MLIIISDLHLGDGTCVRPISPKGFQLFADRLEELALNASWREDTHYRPLENIDILMMGDILDVQHSTSWLDTDIHAPGFVRPWSDSAAPAFAAKVAAITHTILQKNAESFAILRRLARDGIRLPRANLRGQPARIAWRQANVPVRFYYMVGNHDWYYHLPGPAFDLLRQDISTALGLSNPPGIFPWKLEESPRLQGLLNQYQVYARHGDLYDSFNYDQEKGRDFGTLGDVFATEVLNKFPIEVESKLGNIIPPGIIASLRELTNVRPALATPLWISGQLRRNNLSLADQRKIKRLWDDLGHQFIEMDIVRQADRRLKLDIVDGLEMLISLTKRTSFKTLDQIVVWLRKKIWSGEISFSQHALREQAFLERKALFVVYGHTHHQEIIPLDTVPGTALPTNQMYLNSGTWHNYYDLAVYKPKEQKFVPYQVLTYLSFYKEDERMGRRFESWSGAFSE